MATSVRRAPRISVTKLGEYMTAGVVRRRAIVRDQKRPRAVIVARYSRARRVIVDHLTTGRDKHQLIDTIEDIEGQPTRSKWHAQDQLLSVQALDHFLDVELPFDTWQVRRCPGNPPKLDVGGVQVSVRPDLLVRGSTAHGSPWFGAVKVHLSKGFALNDVSAQYSATALHQWVDQYLATPDSPANPRACLVIDVFAQSVWRAPHAHRRRRAHLEAACEEIASRWPVA